MKSYGRAAVSDFLGDCIVYRNLNPMDERLPAWPEIASQLGLPVTATPRKHEIEYARVMAYTLCRARALDDPEARIERLIYIGDTRLQDGTAFENLCHAGGWRGLAFIGDEKLASAPAFTPVHSPHGAIYLANRWALLDDFDQTCRDQDFALDEHTAVVIDLDKTAIGARGRNDSVINRVRVDAVRRTMTELLGDDFNISQFENAYYPLNQPEFHAFTADNQDYLAYICLVVGAGYCTVETLIAAIRAGELTAFRQFIDQVDAASDRLPVHLCEIHRAIYALVRQGDPTPFKAFRYNEYRLTVGAMGGRPDDTPVADLLQEEIVLTEEVRRFALQWKRQGALLFGLSDKPNEASTPMPLLAEQGYLPVHRVITHAVGGQGEDYRET